MLIALTAALALAIASCADGDPIDVDDLCAQEPCAPVDPGEDPGDGDDGPAPMGDDGADEPSGDESGDSGEAPTGGIPCDVVDVLRAECSECHSDPPAFGAPMPLVDYDDLQVPAVSDPSRQVYELVADRLVDEVTPMPPGGMIEATDRDRLLEWVDAGAPEDATAECGDAPDGGDPSGPDALPCDPDFVLTAHAPGTDDPFVVPALGADNLYMCFAFKAPFATATQATAWAPVIDDERVVHHWILYRTKAPQIEGGAVPCDVTLQLSTQFVAGWAPGGGNAVLPNDVGLELGSPDDWYLLQVHYNNMAHHDDVADRSGVAFCTTDQPRENTAGILTVGSIGITIPPLAEDWPVVGMCPAYQTALWPELHVLAGSPHMHQLGRSMRTDLLRLDGTTDTVIDMPAFDFNSQGMYPVEPEIIVKPGDSLVTTCTYDNPGALPVLFGERTQDEMCFNFLLAYPIDKLPSRNCGIPI